MKKQLLGIGFLAGMIAPVYGTDFSLSLNDKSASVELETPISKNIKIGGGYVYSDDKGDLAHFSAHMVHDNGPHHFEIGPKYLNVWFDGSKNGSAVAVGGKYSLQVSKSVSFSAAGYYAPSVLSFSNVDAYKEFDGKMQFNFNPNMAIFAGYRKMKFDYETGGGRTFDNGFYIGGTASF
ncbi:YfaZ family outer membrane protein [Shewanella aestuarii]|uniref:Porin n=1 Tax=Shewanella aestuarii TaxID=1028752 RepID=A0A6G9QJ33_9GAMM|nr:YfaZ family outer membrane protein [Shewanella aestuarii]QIR14075.1 hypothetical protein HBH39_05885 [Shewanella aestuarii]